MKRYFLIAIGIAILYGIAFQPQPLNAQIYGEFSTVTISIESYEPLGLNLGFTLHPASGFALPPNFQPQDHDDGYKKIPFPTGMTFEFNGEVYDAVWVNVNGFCTFVTNPGLPPNVAPDVPEALFIQSNSYPANVVAPYWGDHYYRTQADRFAGYIPSAIKTGWEQKTLVDPNDSTNLIPYKVFIIEWTDLNINDETKQSSVGNFQVRFYESTDPFSKQGDIEFCYGKVGSRSLPDSVGNLVITRGASVGLKGEQTVVGDYSDFMNGLMFDEDPLTVRTSEELTIEWPPSQATDKRIIFSSKLSYKIDEWWGDGDADLSKAEGRKHFLAPQNIFVTVNDARVIMRSVATQVPLDSIRRREAYHGDVTHNGRFYYDNEGIRQDIPWRDKHFSDNLPEGINSIKRIFYQVTEYDASYILHYMAGRVPELPWRYDTVISKGKVGVPDAKATGINFGDVETIDDGLYRVPVYLNGYTKDPMSVRFNLNAEIDDVTGNGNLLVSFSDSRVALAGSGEFNAEEAICYVLIRSFENDLQVSDIRFNDKEVEGFTTNLTSVETRDESEILAQNMPNPFSQNTAISMNIETEGFYTLSVFDIQGNEMKTLTSSNLTAGPHTFFWNGTDEAGNALSNGVYVYRLTGENVTISKKLVLSK